MEKLQNDPIIKFYLKTAASTEYETDLPLFSETILRLAFVKVLGTTKQLNYGLELYKKLLLYYYSEEYNSSRQLLEIMTCFDEASLQDCFSNHDDVMTEWKKFAKNNLITAICKDALFEILCEYAVRYLHLFGEVNMKALHKKAVEVQTLLRNSRSTLTQWVKSFEISLSAKNLMKHAEALENIDVNDLNIKKVIKDVKHKFHPLSLKNAAYDFSSVDIFDTEEPKQKKLKTLQVENENNERIESLDIQILDPADTMAQDEIEDEESSINEELEELEESVDDASQNNEEDLDCGVQCDSTVKDVLEHNSILDSDDLHVANDADEEVDIQSTNSLSDSNDCEDSNESELEDIDKNELDEKSSENDANNADAQDMEIIDYDTALRYITALQAYVVVNGHIDAILLLDKVDSAMRKKHQKL